MLGSSGNESSVDSKLSLSSPLVRHRNVMLVKKKQLLSMSETLTFGLDLPNSVLLTLNVSKPAISTTRPASKHAMKIPIVNVTCIVKQTQMIPVAESDWFGFSATGAVESCRLFNADMVATTGNQNSIENRGSSHIRLVYGSNRNRGWKIVITMLLYNMQCSGMHASPPPPPRPLPPPYRFHCPTQRPYM